MEGIAVFDPGTVLRQTLSIEDMFLPLGELAVILMESPHHEDNGCERRLGDYLPGAGDSLPAIRIYPAAHSGACGDGCVGGVREDYVAALKSQAALLDMLMEPGIPRAIAEEILPAVSAASAAAATALSSPCLPTRSDLMQCTSLARFRAVVLHEIGHHRLSQAKSAGLRPGTAIIGWDDWWLAPARGQQPPTLYAAQDPTEWFAEAYAVARVSGGCVSRDGIGCRTLLSHLPFSRGRVKILDERRAESVPPASDGDWKTL